MSTKQRYARHVALAEVGEKGQASIVASRALIVGLGGLGCPAAQYLASSGVGALTLNDFDRVDETNLPRQILFVDADIGELKAVAAARRLRTLNPAAEITALAERLDAPTLAAAVESATVVLDCTDNVATRLAINKACVLARVPLVTGAAIRFEGQVAVFPNAGAGPCYRCVYHDEDEWLGTCQGNGVLAPVPGVVGTLMAVEALQIALKGRAPLESRLLLWDANHGAWQAVAIKRDPACPVCG